MIGAMLTLVVTALQVRFLAQRSYVHGACACVPYQNKMSRQHNILLVLFRRFLVFLRLRETNQCPCLAHRDLCH